jgi:exodeoxyribonuclease V alpha subunit
LASVEAGSVLGDICDTGNPHNFSGALSKFPCQAPETASQPARKIQRALHPALHVELRDSYRFGTDSGIGA